MPRDADVMSVDGGVQVAARFPFHAERLVRVDAQKRPAHADVLRRDNSNNSNNDDDDDQTRRGKKEERTRASENEREKR